MSMRRALPVLAFVLAGTVVALRAQEPQPPASPRPVSQNVRVEVTISLKGDGKPLVKTLSMVTSDDRLTKGRAGIEIPVLRSMAVGPTAPATVDYRNVGISVDVTPKILDATRVALRMNWQFSTVYKPEGAATSQQPSFGAGQSDVSGVVLESGRPLIVAQAADGETGREYTVEVKATILK